VLRTGDSVVTAGTTSTRLPSPFPRGILIGTVSRIDEGEGELDRRIHVKPAADLRRLDFVQVLTRPQADLRAAVTR
jgi:rod shape-determining protein MreC